MNDPRHPLPLQSKHPNTLNGRPSSPADEFDLLTLSAENRRLREEVARLKSMSGSWASDLDKAHKEALVAKSRCELLKQRFHGRLKARDEEIAGLRRTVSLGHAARLQVERALDQAEADAVRNGKYLDRLESRLRAAGVGVVNPAI